MYEGGNVWRSRGELCTIDRDLRSLGSGVLMIYQNWAKYHWRDPQFEEWFESNLTVLVLKMVSLFPKEVIQDLKGRFGESFDGLSRLERVILITAGTDEWVSHARIKELAQDHPHDISQSLHAFVEKGFRESEGSGKGIFYYLPGEHPMQNEMFGAQRSTQSGSSEHLTGNLVHLDENLVHLQGIPVHLTGSYDRFIDNPDILYEIQRIAKPVSSTGKAPRELIKDTTFRFCEERFLTIDELSFLLGRNKDSLRRRYISQMIENGRILQKYRSPSSQVHLSIKCCSRHLV